MFSFEAAEKIYAEDGVYKLLDYCRLYADSEEESAYITAAESGNIVGLTCIFVLAYRSMGCDISCDGIYINYRQTKTPDVAGLEKASNLLKYCAAADNDDFRALINFILVSLGELLEDSEEEDESNINLALECYKIAADRDSRIGQFKYADMLAYSGYYDNDQEAYEYYLRSANKGYVPAMLQLARFILNGHTLFKNKFHRFLSEYFSKIKLTAKSFLVGILPLLIVGLLTALVGGVYNSYSPPVWAETACIIGFQTTSLVAIYAMVAVLILNSKETRRQLLPLYCAVLVVFPVIFSEVFPVVNEFLPNWIVGISTGFLGLFAAVFVVYLLVYLNQDKRNEKIAYEWIEKAAATGDPNALYKKGSYLYSGIGVKKNRKEAIALYRAAAGEDCAETDESKKYSTDAMIALGDLYRHGIGGVSKDFDKAFALYKRAADLGDYDGQYMLGYCYELGIGTPQNLEEADRWYRMGRENGSTLASRRLNRPMRFGILSRLFGRNRRAKDERIKFLEKELASKDQQLTIKDQQLTIALGEIAETNKIILTNTNAILSNITTLLSEVATIKDQHKKELDKAERENEGLEDVIQKISVSICASMEKAAARAGDASRTEVTNYLKGVFGSSWDDMAEYSRKSLLSALVFLNISTDSSLDYSGVCIAACSALEMELKNLFFTGYIEHLKKGKDISKWPSSLTYKDKKDQTLKPVDKFTLGNFVFICGLKGNEAEEHASSMKEYLLSISKGDVSVSIQQLHNFAERCQKLCDGFRNPAAHTDSVSRTQAEECCHRIVCRDDAHTEVGKITGLLYELLTMFKAP